MSILERIERKINALKINGVEPKNLVVSKPVALELIYDLRVRFNRYPLNAFVEDLDGATVLGLRVTLLRINREILEVG